MLQETLGQMGPAMHPIDPQAFDFTIERSSLLGRPDKFPQVMLPLSIVAGNAVRSASSMSSGAFYRMSRVAATIAVVNNAALLETPLAVDLLLSTIDPDMRPFGAEAVGMGYYSRFIATEKRENLFAPYLQGPGARFGGLPYTGIGMSAQKLGVPVLEALGDVTGFFKWHVLDGFSFWGGRWQWEKLGATRAPCAEVSPDLYPAYDRGLGRSAWFNFGADPSKVAAWAEGFEAGRKPFIWAGVGVASTFTGGCEMDALAHLKSRANADGMSGWLAAGSTHGLATRRWCGCDSAYNRRAVEALTGRTADDAAAFAKEMLERVSNDDADSYRTWYSLMAN